MEKDLMGFLLVNFRHLRVAFLLVFGRSGRRLGKTLASWVIFWVPISHQ